MKKFKKGLYILIGIIVVILGSWLIVEFNDWILRFTGKEDEGGIPIILFSFFTILIVFIWYYFLFPAGKNDPDRSYFLRTYIPLLIVVIVALFLFWRYESDIRFFFQTLCLPWWVILISLGLGIFLGYKLRE